MRKKTIEEVRKAFADRGYTLLSTEYVNAYEKLQYKCHEGHLNMIRWHDFNSDRGCPDCAKNKKYSIEKVSTIFSSIGYFLISTEYKNHKTKLGFICDKGHSGNMSLGSILAGCRCLHCSGQIVTYGLIKQAFFERGYRLITNEYTDNKQKLVYECSNGHICSISWNDFTQGCGCPFCARKKVSFEFILGTFLCAGYTLISTDYKNNHTPLRFVCSEGHNGAITWANFRRGQRCSLCVGGPVSKSSQAWLDSVGIPNVMGVNREVRLPEFPNWKVDGFDPTTNIVYEFLGDLWHGNPEMFSPEYINPMNKKLAGEAYQETMVRLEAIKRAGYNLVYIWEADFLKQQKQKEI